MVETYTPTSITSICKNILPFSFKKRRIPAITAEQHLSKQQSDNLKWQQETFHQILNMIGRCKEGIISENEVSAFRTHLLETLIASPIDLEPTAVLRDKLIFLQELLHGKCISEEDYHASKRPLLQRLAVQGAEIDARDVIIGAHKSDTSNEEWSVIDLKDDNKYSSHQNVSTSKNYKKSIQSSTVKKMKGAVSFLGFMSQDNNNNQKLREETANNALLNGQQKNNSKSSILMKESSLAEKLSLSDKGKKRVKLGKKTWVFDGFKKWKKNDDSEDALWFVDEKTSTDGASYGGKLVENPVGEGPDTKQIKRKLHPNGAPTDFFVDKVLGGKIKKELSQIQTERGAKHQKVYLSDEEIEVISTRLPVDKADLKMFFPKSWCDEYGDIVLDVVRKEFKEHMREMGKLRHNNKLCDENSHPNLSSSQNCRLPVNISSSIDKGFKYNPFFDV